MAIVDDKTPVWFRDDVGPLQDYAFPTRFREDCWRGIVRVSNKYGVSRTMAIRILVQRALRDLGEL